MPYKLKSNKKGFTIVELMISTVVFSAAALLVMAAVIGMARQYQKGSYTVQLNDASRSIHQDIRDNLSYGNDYKKGSGLLVDGVNYEYVCFGRTIYYWSRPSVTNINYGLYKHNITGNGCSDPGVNLSKDANLLPAKGYVTQFDIPPAQSGVYTISTRFNVGTPDMYVQSGGNPDYSTCLPTLRGGDFCSVMNYTSNVMPK